MNYDSDGFLAIPGDNGRKAIKDDDGVLSQEEYEAITSCGAPDTNEEEPPRRVQITPQRLTDEEVWLRVFTAQIGQRQPVDIAAIADLAVKAFRDRFPK
jgi:hypothetical protein